MLTTLVALAVAVIPIVSVWGLLELAAWQNRRRQETANRQIALTDAIWREVGAVASPVVKRPFFGPWQIQIAVPFSRPATVGTVLSVAHRILSFADRMGPRPYQIVLTPQDEIAPPPGSGKARPALRAKAA